MDREQKRAMRRGKAKKKAKIRAEAKRLSPEEKTRRKDERTAAREAEKTARGVYASFWDTLHEIGKLHKVEYANFWRNLQIVGRSMMEKPRPEVIRAWDNFIANLTSLGRFMTRGKSVKNIGLTRGMREAMEEARRRREKWLLWPKKRPAEIVRMEGMSGNGTIVIPAYVPGPEIPACILVKNEGMSVSDLHHQGYTPTPLESEDSDGGNADVSTMIVTPKVVPTMQAIMEEGKVRQVFDCPDSMRGMPRFQRMCWQYRQGQRF